MRWTHTAADAASRPFLQQLSGLTSIPDGFFDQLTGLTYRNVGHNQLTSLPTSISGLTSLTLFVLYTQLTSLTTSIRELYLSFNELTSIPDGFFDQLMSLTTLQLGSAASTSLQVTTYKYQQLDKHKHTGWLLRSAHKPDVSQRGIQPTDKFTHYHRPDKSHRSQLQKQ